MATTETHFNRFWRELDTALAAESEGPARYFEAAPRYDAEPDMDAVVRDILRSRVIAAEFADAFVQIKKAA
jgi:hypothetical protein